MRYFVQTHEKTDSGKVYKLVDESGKIIRLLLETALPYAVKFEEEIEKEKHRDLYTEIDALKARLEKLEKNNVPAE